MKRGNDIFLFPDPSTLLEEKEDQGTETVSE
jgi:hypothetical protein